MAIHPAKDAELHATPPQDAGTQEKTKTTPAKSGKTKGETTMMKKIGALVLAIVMIAMVGLAFADPATTGNDTNKKTGGTPETISEAGVVDGTTSDGTKITGATAQNNTVRIYKDIVIFNASSSNTVVYLPNMTYNYSIGPADVTDNSKYITDEFDTRIVIQDGESAALNTTAASITYSAANGVSSKSGSAEAVTIISTPYVTTSTSGAAATGYFDISFNPGAFSHAGVYRYQISESAADDRDDAGIYNKTYDHIRYLDVYVMNSGDTYAIYGYVLFEGLVNDEFDADEGSLTESTSGKTNGFVSDHSDLATNYSASEEDVDLYYTYNLRVEKQVDGALGDKTHQFPFQVVLSNTAIDTAAKFSYRYNSEDGSSATAEGVGTKTLSSGSATIGSATATVADNFKLRDDEYIYVFGVPSYAYNGYTGVTPVLTTAVVTEYNDTYDTYNVEAKYNDVTDATLNGTVTIARGDTAATTSTDSLLTANKDTMVVTNTINAISPTGYVARIAPYALILIAGIALLIVAKKRKPAKEEE